MAVFEKGRRDIEVAFFECDVFLPDEVVKRVLRGRMGLEDIESLSN
jgi:hypothetical protein